MLFLVSGRIFLILPPWSFYGDTASEASTCLRYRKASQSFGIYSGRGKNNELIAATEAAIGELYYSFCELGENVEERIQADPQRTVSGNVVHGTSG